MNCPWCGLDPCTYPAEGETIKPKIEELEKILEGPPSPGETIKPTIAELEKILEGPPGIIEILPSGEVIRRPPPPVHGPADSE